MTVARNSTRIAHQKLPGAGPAREALREKGQFWTPTWVAEAMVAYVLRDGGNGVFDPAVGEGVFFRAAKTLARELHRKVLLAGTEIDPTALRQARENGLTEGDLAGVQIRDFVLNPPSGLYTGIVANPPYIRHHRLPERTKERIREMGAHLIGRPLDGRAGLHVYFLLQALRLLATNARLAFIMPADTCEGVFAGRLWAWATSKFRLEAVVTFEPEASPFPGVDTNAVVFLIQRASPNEEFLWARVTEAWTGELKAWVLSGFAQATGPAVRVYRRRLSEGLTTGLSRYPVGNHAEGPKLGDYAYVVRGIATGNNDFFFLTRKEARSLSIPEEFLLSAVGRTRDVDGDEITPDTMAALDAAGRPTLLLSLDGRPLDAFPPGVRDYLKHGEALGVPRRALIGQRHPWYKMEIRPVPPFLFAYLGRRNARFIRNLAGVVPLTGFLCVYPRQRHPGFVTKLWRVLQHPETVANLPLVGKSYGSGAIKVEPRALERLPLPESVVREAGLSPVRLLAV